MVLKLLLLLLFCYYYPFLKCINFIGRWRDSVVDSPNKLRFPVVTFPDGSVEFRVAWGVAPNGRRKRDTSSMPSHFLSHLNSTTTTMTNELGNGVVRILPVVKPVHIADDEFDETLFVYNNNARPSTTRKRGILQSTTCLPDTLICPGMKRKKNTEFTTSRKSSEF